MENREVILEKRDGETMPDLAPEVGSLAFTPVDPTVLRDIIEENLGPNGLDPAHLNRVSVGIGGATSFTLQTAEGETQTPTITGIMVIQQRVRRFWHLGLEQSGGGAPPDCTADDALTGVGDPGGQCCFCPNSQFVDRRPPACKEQRLVYILREREILPVVVAVPPSSLAAFDKYLLRLTSQGLPFYAVVTTLQLERARSNGGIAYSRVVARMTGRLTPEHLTHVQACRNVLQAFRRSAPRVVDQDPSEV